MKKAALILLGAAFLLQSCNSGNSGSSDKPIDLKFNFQSGEKYGYSTSTKQHMTAAGMSVDQDIKMDNTYSVSAADGDNKKITASFSRIVMQMGGNGIVIMYDSKDPQKQDAHLKFMGGLIDKPFSMVVTPKGEIISVSGLTDAVKALNDSAGMNDQMKNQVAQMFSDTSVRAILQQSFYIFPDKPVKPGDTWKKEISVPGMVSMDINSTFKLASVTGKVAHLEVNSVIKGMTPPDGPMKDLKMDGTQKGVMDVVISSGLVSACKIHQAIKGSIKDMNGKEFPINVSTDIEITGQEL